MCSTSSRISSLGNKVRSIETIPATRGAVPAVPRCPRSEVVFGPIAGLRCHGPRRGERRMTGVEQRRVLCGPPRAAHLAQIRSHAAGVSRAQMLAGDPRLRHHPPRITDDVENERRLKTVGNPLQRQPDPSTLARDRVATLAREPLASGKRSVLRTWNGVNPSGMRLLPRSLRHRNRSAR